MAKQMTKDDALAFIAAKPRTAKVATMRADGRPHVVPVWVALDGEEIIFTVGESSLKYKAFRRDPRAAICFDDETPPFTFVTIEGEVTLSHDMDELREWAGRIGGRYMGADRADEYGERNAVPEEYVVRFRPTKFVGVQDIAD
jgi:PPOX class probable F420-dependent enzyme